MQVPCPIEEMAPPAIEAEFFAERLNALGIDVKAEEKQLRTRIAEFVAWASASQEPLASAQLSDSVLPLSLTEWQSLVSECTVGEISFRADLNRALRRAVGLLAAIQEEMALYTVRQNSEHLCKKHLHTLLYLAQGSTQLLPELERIAQQAATRGLLKKAGDVSDTRSRLSDCIAAIAKLHPAQADRRTDDLQVDPKLLETRWQDLMAQLVSSARSADESVSEIPLANTVLTTSATERQALVSDCPPGEQSFRADLSRTLREAVALRAAIQEEIALYRASRTSRLQWRGHLSSLLYLAEKAEQILPRLEQLLDEASQRNLTTKTEHLAETKASIERHLKEISALRGSLIAAR